MKENNKVIDILLNHKNIRSYKSDSPSDETIEKIVRTGQQAPFVSQMYSGQNIFPGSRVSGMKNRIRYLNS